MGRRVVDMLGCHYPVLGFSHSPKVVAAVSRAGGFGVFGAGTLPPEIIERDLAWIGANCDGAPFGVDLLLPGDSVGADTGGLSSEEVAARLPQAHREFVADLLHRYDVPGLPDGADPVGRLDMTRAGAHAAGPLLDACFSADVKLIARALGPPPAALVERASAAGAVVAALAGTVDHAIGHQQAGADLIVAQGTEAGGHTGDISTMVLVPDVVDAVGAATPVVAAGGIATGRQMAASMALGAEGVWCGSVWLTTEEAETEESVREKFLRATARETVRCRSLTGKSARMLRSAWTDSWRSPDAPVTLPIPLQSALVAEAQQRIVFGAAAGRPGAVALANYFVGQVVGRLGETTTVERALGSMLAEYGETLQRMTKEAG